MKQLFVVLLAMATGVAAQSPPVFLESGDYRWVPLNIRQTPTRVDVTFQVVEGDGRVHVELIPEAAFRPMQQGRPHGAIAATTEGALGTLQTTIEDPGRYRVVIANHREGRPTKVRWRVATELNPPVAARELTPQRRLAVIGISFLLFFAMVGYSGWKLRKGAADLE